ncbi:TetR family transcriptional regulator [Sporichthya sp.]|uniref:TetR family transcriptional regulator n=1 Tax=Sporichthya sp. TaxID=65475 RepID=UPI0018526410|nr:TetR family transcriptional regulator [Sporichthya sp.]MBA3745074.1 TetR family transcriptional regulator [Sporichthya sp.]
MTARDRILAAVEELIGQGGFKAVSIASAAGAAGVSRQTVYANFGTLEDLVAEAVTEVSTRALGEIAEQIDAVTDAGAYAVELIVAARAAFRDTPALAILVFPESGNPMFEADMMTNALPIVEAFVAPLFERAPHLMERQGDVVEVLLRTGLGVLLFNSDAIRSDADLRGFLTRTLLPAMGLAG